MIINGDLKIDYLFFTLIIDAFEYPNYKYFFLFTLSYQWNVQIQLQHHPIFPG